MTLTDLPEVAALSPLEKLQLVDELWLSVAQELDSLDVSQKARLDVRWAAFLENPGSTLSIDDFKKRMNALRR